MFKEKRTFKNSRGLKLSAIYEGKNKNAPVVVICHGYGSSKDSESNIHLAQELVKMGQSAYRFDFTGSGQSQGKLDQCTPLQGLDDLKSAVKDLGKEKFALQGTSFGGYVALMYAIQNPVLALGLKAPVSDYKSVEAKKSKDNLSFTDKKKNSFIKELKDINIYQLAKKITAPTLVVHGSADEIVPFSQSERLLKSLAGEKRLVVLPNARHRMRGTDMEQAHNLLSNFFKQTLLK